MPDISLNLVLKHRKENDMTQEQRQLLLKDLCARLPHKQKVCYKIHDNSEEITETLSGCLLDYFKTGKIAVVKPYLRTMSSMTEKEIKEYRSLSDEVDVSSYLKCVIHCIKLGVKPDNPHEGVFDFVDMDAIDWLNAHRFDYRGLIEEGLAIEAPEGMYKIK